MKDISLRIEGLGMAAAARSIIAALPRIAPTFTLRESEPHAPELRGAPPQQPSPTVEMLVALAAADPRVERRRRMAAEADRGLGALEKLHTELVAGTPTPERLAELVEWVQTSPQPEDPQLATLWREIDVRVRVELAKYDVEV